MNNAEIAARKLRFEYGIPVRQAKRCVEIAHTFSVKCLPDPDGRAVTIRYHRPSDTYEIVPGVPSAKEMGFRASASAGSAYTSRTPVGTGPNNKEKIMPRGRAAAAVAEEEVAGEKDYTVYAGKPATPLMQDFAEWIKQEVGVDFPSKAAEAAFDNGVRLGGTLRMEFQKSDFCKERRAERQAEKAAENGATVVKAGKRGRPAATEDVEDEPAVKPAKAPRGRAAARATAKPGRPAAGARRGRAAAKPVVPVEDDEEEAPY